MSAVQLDDWEAGELSVEFEGCEPWELLEWSFERFGERLAISTSFQEGGVALIEVFTSVDDFEGDLDGYHRRPPATYDRWFDEAGLARIGPHLYAARPLLRHLAAFERS